jgi:arsenate reductase
MTLRLYAYAGCDTCRKAKKWLRAEGLEFEEIPIRDQPPSEEELARVLDASGGELRRLFNTSSKDYREAGLKDRLPSLNPAEAFALLRQNGNLVKRPVLLGEGVALVGFQPDRWADALKGR